MGRHSASYISAQQGVSAGPTAAGAAKYVGCVCALALAMGVGAAVAGGAGIADAEGPTASSSGGGTAAESSPNPDTDKGGAPDASNRESVGGKTRKSQRITVSSPTRVATTTKKSKRPGAAGSVVPAKAEDPNPAVSPPGPEPVPRLAGPVAPAISSFLRPFVPSPAANTGGSPEPPLQMALGALQLLRRELETGLVRQVPSTAAFTFVEAYANAHPAIAPGEPSPADEVPTAYGDIGKWMLKSDGQLANYGGQTYDGGKTMLEPVNVIIVDPNSKTPAEAARRLNTAMFWAGFPAQPIHSSGFEGSIDDVTYGQQPGFLQGYSDNFFLLPNNHGRIFGPDPVETSTEYVWSGTFSRETLGFAGLPGHIYVSSDVARAALAMRLIVSGQATFVGMVPLDNAYNTATTTTGDHDGYAVVLQLK
ncbi:hypothetical protein BH09ACT7_BH09ACT7_49950 [soil metagenome]